MIYECDQCSKALPPSVQVCPSCGEEFDDVVPADAEVPKRGFSAATPIAESAAPLMVAPLTAAGPFMQREGSYNWLEPPLPDPPKANKGGSSGVLGLGVLLLLAGLAAIIYFFIVFDTSVALPDASSSVLGISRVNNLGLMADRQNGIIMGMGTAILGAILMFAGQRK